MAEILREGDVSSSSAIAKAYDADFHFMLVEIADEGFYFQAINRAGKTIDAGSLVAASAAAATADTTGRR